MKPYRCRLTLELSYTLSLYGLTCIVWCLLRICYNFFTVFYKGCSLFNRYKRYKHQSPNFIIFSLLVWISGILTLLNDVLVHLLLSLSFLPNVLYCSPVIDWSLFNYLSYLEGWMLCGISLTYYKVILMI